MDHHTIRDGGIEAVVAAAGAELQSLKDATGREYLWQAGPAWPRRAPNLFPIVGRLKNDTLRHRGQSFAMTQHGFARDRTFQWQAREADSCDLALRDDDSTRAVFPFAFSFGVSYRIARGALAISYSIENTGDETLPASVGAHPAFRWPLEDGRGKEDYTITFEKRERAPVRRLNKGLLMEDTFPSPVGGNTLRLTEALFDADALIMDRAESRSVRYGAYDGPAVEVSWDDDFTELGIWSKPPGDFVCIEPWRGMASPEDFGGEILKKPGMMLLKPGESRTLSWRIRLF